MGKESYFMKLGEVIKKERFEVQKSTETKFSEPEKTVHMPSAAQRKQTGTLQKGFFEKNYLVTAQGARFFIPPQTITQNNFQTGDALSLIITNSGAFFFTRT